jgi:hypothetical protein
MLPSLRWEGLGEGDYLCPSKRKGLQSAGLLVLFRGKAYHSATAAFSSSSAGFFLPKKRAIHIPTS